MRLVTFVAGMSATVGTAVDGILGIEPYIDGDSDGWKAFNQSWMSISGRIGRYAIGDLPSNDTRGSTALFPDYGQPAVFEDNKWPAYNYDTVYVVAKALHSLFESAPTPESAVEDIKDWSKMVRTIRNVMHSGATGDISMTKTGDLIASFSVKNVYVGADGAATSFFISKIVVPGSSVVMDSPARFY